MKKNLLMTLALAAVLSLTLGGAVSANCGKCPGDKAGSKADQPCCKSAKACMDAEKALQDDLAKLEKGIPAADQAAFLKAHQENLKKFFDAKAECKKECEAKGGKDKKACPAHAEKEKKG